MQIEDDDLIFEATGRRLCPNCNIVGIDAAGETFSGYDQRLVDYHEPALSDDERRELADFMIER